MGRVTGHNGLGGFGSLTWHENWLLSLESVSEINQYLDRLMIAPLTDTDLEQAKVNAFRLVKEKEQIWHD